MKALENRAHHRLVETMLAHTVTPKPSEACIPMGDDFRQGLQFRQPW